MSRAHTRSHAQQKLADKDDWDNVGDALEHVYELAPDCIDAMLISGQARLEGGDFEGCVMETGRVLKIQPNHVDALILRGEAHFLMEVRPSAATCRGSDQDGGVGTHARHSPTTHCAGRGLASGAHGWGC